MSIISTDIAKAIAILNNDDVVAIPTETVYGLAGNIYSEKAINRIFAVKKRPFFNPLIVHVHDVEEVDKLVTDFPEKARLLALTFWPGSLTLILPKKDAVPDLITAGKDSVAVRVPNHPVTLELLRQLDFPLAAPSANPFGSISPTKAIHVNDYFENDIAMVLEGGSCANGIESTIVGFENGEPIVYRLGSISLEELEAVVGPVSVMNKKENAPVAPGMLSRHYAPKTRTYLVDNVATFIANHTDKKIGVITHDEHIETTERVTVIKLSSTADLKQAAAALYSSMHHLDTLDLDLIVAQRFPDTGMGRAINDRLERAT
ncbi:MAG: L-threonylcarbamoyladenylate synthase, partial [Nonlabens sp.]|nr:L-threonylcarbamoyladenylate synthase [Nonlabens sp.]